MQSCELLSVQTQTKDCHPLTTQSLKRREKKSVFHISNSCVREEREKL